MMLHRQCDIQRWKYNCSGLYQTTVQLLIVRATALYQSDWWRVYAWIVSNYTYVWHSTLPFHFHLHKHTYLTCRSATHNSWTNGIDCTCGANFRHKQFFLSTQPKIKMWANCQPFDVSSEASSSSDYWGSDKERLLETSGIIFTFRS